MPEAQKSTCPVKHNHQQPHKNKLKSHTMSDPPGPRGPPVFGQAFNLDTDHMHIQFMEWQKNFGDMFMFKILGKNYMVISHPDIIRKLFVTCPHASRFNDRPASFMGKYVIHRTKDIVFRNMDEKQQYLKNAALEYVENTLQSDTWFYEAVSEEIRSVVSDITHLKDDFDIDIIGTMDRTAAKIIGLLLTGNRLAEVGPEYECLVRFMDAGNELGTVKNQSLLTKIPGLRKLPGHLKDTYDLLDENRTLLKQHYITNNKSDRGLVAMLRGLQKQVCTKYDKGVTEEAWLTDDFIMGIIMDLTAAGIVPLQNTLSVLFLVLVHDVSVQEKIRAEIDTLTSDVTVDDLTKMPYTSACMLELKRFHTPLPISARHSNRSGDATFQEYNIPKDTEIFSNLFGIHHDERFWSEPWSFQPERFLTEDGKLVPADHPNMNNLVATGIGPRKCVASKFSDNILFLITVTLLKNFAILPSRTDMLPACDPRQFTPGVVTRAPDFKCLFQDASRSGCKL